jgi:hypothetical protein
MSFLSRLPTIHLTDILAGSRVIGARACGRGSVAGQCGGG